MDKRLLPIGSVVELKRFKKKIVIVGFRGVNENSAEKVVFDYIGFLYPSGFINKETTLLFNHDDISLIYFVGLQSVEDNEFKDELIKKYYSEEV